MSVLDWFGEFFEVFRGDGNADEIAQEIKEMFSARYPGCSVTVRDGDYATCATIRTAEGEWITEVYSGLGRGLVREARYALKRLSGIGIWGAKA